MKYPIIKALVFCVAFSAALAGCLPSMPGGGRPERKKMFTSDALEGEWEGSALTVAAQTTAPRSVAFYSPLPFTLVDTTINLNGEEADYMLLRLPTADYDYLLLAAKNYESWLPTWLAAWPQSGRHGVAIELNGGTATERADFQVTVPGLSEPIPLILFWDAHSADRAAFIAQFLQNLTTIHCEKLK